MTEKQKFADRFRKHYREFITMEISFDDFCDAVFSEIDQPPQVSVEPVVMPMPEAKNNNILRVHIELGGLEGDEDESYFTPNFVRHIEFTSPQDLIFMDDEKKALTVQFNLELKQLIADYKRHSA